MKMLPEVSSAVQELIEPEFMIDNNTLKEVMIRFKEEIKKGLKKSTHKSSEVKCFVTYVTDLPTGNERGTFLALDLGGTNYRVLLIHIKGEDLYESKSKTYKIPKKIMLGPGTELFDYAAKCLAEFLKEMNIQNTVLPLGFTFSFPCQQFGLKKGILTKWTKGFKCGGVVNENVVELLEDAIKRRNVSR